MMQQIDEEANCSSQSLIEAPWPIRLMCECSKFRRLQKIGKLHSPIQVLWIVRQSIHVEQSVSIASDTMAQSGSFCQ